MATAGIVNARVKMGTVWDRTTEVLAGRAGMLAGIAVPTLFLPTIVRDAYVAYATPGTVSFATIGGILTIGTLLLTLWGQLQLIAVASDPATTTPAARKQATARLLPLIGVSIVLGIVATVLLIPAIALIAGSGLDFQAIAAGQAPTPSPDGAGSLGLATLYFLAFSVAALFVGARLATLNAVILHERLGLGAVPRAWRLTRGHTWRLVGVMLLFVIVLLVAALAAQSVTGLVFRLILGPDNIATSTLLAGIVGSAVVTVFSVMASVFVAQLYVALIAERDQTPAV